METDEMGPKQMIESARSWKKKKKEKKNQTERLNIYTSS